MANAIRSARSCALRHEFRNSACCSECDCGGSRLSWAFQPSKQGFAKPDVLSNVHVPGSLP
eukprot:13842412-Alexandrium_andersonii.AAC.1